jgi:GH24 family phage-related lysozyme (muramidase)
MNISQNGINLIKKFESVRLKSYNATGEERYLTIGYGHYGPDVKPGQTITQAEAEALLKKDLKKFVEGVNALIHVPLNQNQADALYSFAYNCGVQALAKSTLLSELNSKDYKSAANEFLKWTRGSGKILPGLVTRRETERALFLKPVPQPQPYPGNVIKEGSTNTVAVKEIQKQLGITADGVFGPNTKAAVVKFQKAHGLASDGIVGNVTWNVLF